MTNSFQEEATKTLDIVSHSPAQTQRLGMRLGELLQEGDLLLMDGGLGTGKTTFTQGLAKGMHIFETISSPTFTLLKEYSGPSSLLEEPAQSRSELHLYHFDLYRLDDPAEMLDLGFEDYFSGSGVCVVEWAGKADQLWRTAYPEHLRIRMKVISETKRGLLFTATSAHYCSLLRQFQKNSYATLSS